MTPSVTDYGKLLLVTSLYLLLAKISWSFGLCEHNVTLFWPASGFALAILLSGQQKYLAAIVTGAYLSGMLQGSDQPTSLLLALVQGVESWTAYYLLKKMRFSILLDRMRDYSLLILVAMAASSVTVIGGLLRWSYAVEISVPNLTTHCLRWWLADVLGIVFVTPLILFWPQPALTRLHSWRALELGTVFILTFAVGQAVFWDGRLLGMPESLRPILFWLMPLVIWAGIRLGRHWTATLLL